MVHTSTYILVLLTFVLSIFGFHRYFQHHTPEFGYGKLILLCIAVEFVMLSIVVSFPACFPLLIYGSVCMGSFVCTYYRYRQKIGGEW